MLPPPISNPEKWGNIHDLVMEISKSFYLYFIDQLYSATNTLEELYYKKWPGKIMPNRKGFLVTLKTTKGRRVLSSEVMQENNSKVMIAMPGFVIIDAFSNTCRVLL